MVTIAVTAEGADEPRVAISPETVKKLTALGCKVRIEAGAGARSRFSDEVLKAQGAEIASRECPGVMSVTHRLPGLGAGDSLPVMQPAEVGFGG